MHSSSNERFIERIGRFFEAEGAPRTAGRILGLMLLTPAELTLDEIAEALQVSKASISTNARRMEMVGVLERYSHPGDRRDFYRVPQDIAARLLERQLRRIRQLRELVEEGGRTDAASDPRVECRFRVLDGFHACAATALEDAVQRFPVDAAEAGEGSRAS
jgi:DNA-binding transcriptional regulator GbsR (MarR family)